MAEHEEMVLDLAACTRCLREKREVEKMVLLGNCGGGSLAAFHQAEARLAPAARLVTSPGGSLTRFDTAALRPADAMIYVAAHRGQGKILQAAIDPSVVHPKGYLHWPGRQRAPWTPFDFPVGMRRCGLSLV